MRATTVIFAVPRTVIFLCAIATVAGVLLLGLPGVFLYQAFSAFELRAGFQAVKPDAAWPIALIVSILWPWGILLGYGLARRIGKKYWFVLLVEFVWLSLICFVLSVIPG